MGIAPRIAPRPGGGAGYILGNVGRNIRARPFIRARARSRVRAGRPANAAKTARKQAANVANRLTWLP